MGLITGGIMWGWLANAAQQEKDMELSFAMACKQYFGLRDGQSLQEFAQEVKQLNEQDRAEITKFFVDAGIAIKA